ncbi:MAG: hypothetical protein A2427_02690 [Candidatus Nealsonbacteria bacterium RIFOXYC1_FULL_40_7]|uniref:PEP-utilising enzyme mobile domain-containing protein n=1 Tax=Candidatus Nealsonbacteria bacterium RIFOXYC1_FULL_40_7 TaxID=1801678 RepID=A0A1G2EPB3_9BACT|nr:MAG: hypothetical protein A2427_02690 [Candidatus Nealsonbacteria bacterium RIFOXYC1_FULL_40_7]
MDKIEIFKKALEKDWYIQGFNAVPLFLNLPASSGFYMKDELGFGYSQFFFSYKEGYGEMGYLNADLERLWGIIKSKIKENPEYLKEIKKRYEEIFSKRHSLFKKIDEGFSDVTDGDLLEMLKECALCEREAVGIAHLLEPIGMEIDKEFKNKLSEYIKDKKELNQIYGILGAPKMLSFIAKEERELKQIGSLGKTEQKNALENHLKKYFWIQNSYAVPKELGTDFFRKRMKKLGAEDSENKAILSEKEKIFLKYKFDPEVMEVVEIIGFTTTWQDERKANTLRAVSYLGRVVKEVSERIRVKTENLYYLGFTDVFGLRSIDELKKMQDELENRSKGVMFIMSKNKEVKITRKEYQEIAAYRKRVEENTKEVNDIHGSTASGGTAIGRVAVCKGLDSLDKVKKGDVLVASMTRPEYMAAIKKAAEIVTDEGGITCHAAIVARELGIPAIIGTKIATKMLKDGMIVEVKANHGLVRIIK